MAPNPSRIELIKIIGVMHVWPAKGPWPGSEYILSKGEPLYSREAVRGGRAASRAFLYEKL